MTGDLIATLTPNPVIHYTANRQRTNHLEILMLALQVFLLVLLFLSYSCNPDYHNGIIISCN